MATKKILRRERASNGIHDRALFREGELEAAQMVRNHERREQQPEQPLTLTPASRVRTGSPSDAAACLAFLEAMRARFGELALLTWTMRPLDPLPLKSNAVASRGRKSIEAMLRMYAPRAVAYRVSIQRGEQIGCTHGHLVLPLAHLGQALRATAQAAPAGKGGGAEHIPGRLHVVCIADTPVDLARVASYTTRDPDCRFDLPEDHPDFLQAQEEERRRKLSGNRSPHLAWPVGRSLVICR